MKLLLVGFLVFISKVNGDSVASCFRNFEIVPDVLTTPPNDILTVNYDGIILNLGDELTPTQVRNTPVLSWNANPSCFYTVAMIDPDAPSRQDPQVREFKHWLVVNVPGLDVSQGDTLTAYVGSGAPKGTGLHRYVLLVYKQPGILDVSAEKRVGNNSREGRPKFSIQKFADRYGLGAPIAGNMFMAQYDDYVPTIHKQLSGQ